MDLLVICVFAYWFMKHGPQIVVEAAQGIGYGLRGEESPAAKARRERLQDAGYDPAGGGAFGQYAGNLLRDFWLDQDNARRTRRAGQPDGGTGRETSGWRGRWDAKVDEQAGKWRRRTGQPDPGAKPGPDFSTDDGPSSTTDDPDADLPQDTEPIRVKATVGEPAGGPAPFSEGNPPESAPGPPSADPDDTPPAPPGTHRPEERMDHQDDEDDADWGPVDPVYARHEVFADCNPLTCPHPDHSTPPSRGPAPTTPIKVQNPATATAVLEPEGDTMSATVATRGIPVTGVQSGAAECLSINRELETAIAEFRARLANIAARTHSMGDQTLGIVQFAGRSDVVVRMAQAAEAIAATTAQAVALGTEVSPLLMQTRAEFLRRA